MSDRNIVYIVHCIDTEGPLYESLDETFERIYSILGIRMKPSAETLRQIQRKEIDLGGKEELAAEIFSERLLAYNDSWSKIDSMLDEMISEPYRKKFADSQGNGWIYNWFCVDHVGYDDNPRRRDIGYHNVFDHYMRRGMEPASLDDEIHFHFHPMSRYREAHICATSYIHSPHFFEILSRRIVDRGWFPSCFRAGFHVERPDSHWLLEQWIPYDFSNQSMREDQSESSQNDVADGRLGDWRRAPDDWSHYNPDHDDYQIPGRCRRSIFRCLNVGTRMRLLNREEIERAFKRSQSGNPTILAFTNHDFRDMRYDVRDIYGLLKQVSRNYKDVTWLHSGAKQAAQKVLGHDNGNTDFEFTITFSRIGSALKMDVESTYNTFGPQPYLAVKTHDHQYFNDNFDIHIPHRKWSYMFDYQTINPDSITQIGVASNSEDGRTCVDVYSPEGQIVIRMQY
jgi:hypothetical protein